MQHASVEQPRVGNSACADELVELIPSLRAFALALCRSSERAEELVYETLLDGIVHIEERDPDMPMRAWLFTMMRNAFHTGVRLSHQGGPEPPAWIVGPAQGRCMRQRAAARAVCALPPEQREAIVLVEVLGMSSHDAAQVCGCSPAQVERRLDRARRALTATLVGPAAVEVLRPG